MKLLALVALTATAAWIAPAAAQTVPDPNPYYGVSPNPDMPPPPHRRAAPPAGTTWHAPPPDAQMPTEGSPPQTMGQQRTYVVHRMAGENMGPERRRVEYRRIERGGTVPQRWWGDDVQVRNWRTYGFPEPFEGGRWVRYYDDALLIDGGGRVYDSMKYSDWDGHSERWGRADDGVPVYVGNGDFQPRRRDYQWAEHWDRRQMARGPHVEERSYVEQAPMLPMTAAPPCGHPCGGYSYGYAPGPVLVSETVETFPAVVEQRTYVSYETVRVRVKHRHHVVHRCTCRVAAPPPPPGGGERG